LASLGEVLLSAPFIVLQVLTYEEDKHVARWLRRVNLKDGRNRCCKVVRLFMEVSNYFFGMFREEMLSNISQELVL
jgi:hypothetical protein